MEKHITIHGIIEKKWTPKLHPYNLKYSLPVLIEETEKQWHYISPAAEGLDAPIMVMKKINSSFLDDVKLHDYDYTKEDKDYILQFIKK